MKKSATLLLIFLISILFNQGLTAQNREYYSTDNGLSNSLINQIYQDRRGFIWIATEYGLNRFDGINFTIYKHIDGDSTSLKHNYVRTLFEDSSGNFYVGTILGLMKYDWATDSFKDIKMYREGKLVRPHVISIIETHNGDIWLTTSGQSVFILKKGTDDVFSDPVLTKSLSSNFLNCIFQDSKFNIWIGSENDGLNCYDPRTKKTTVFKASHGINSNNISAIKEDIEGNIYVGTLTQGLSKYNPKTQTFDPILYKGSTQLLVSSLMINKNDQLYIGTDGQGLMMYNREKNIIEDYEVNSPPFDFSKGKIHSILQDKDQNLWLGIFQKGVIFIPVLENKFNYYGYKSFKNNPIGSSCVTAIYKDKEGVTWIGTDNDGIYGINNNGARISHFYRTASPNSVPNIIHSIFEDSSGDIWLGSYANGLAKFNQKTGYCEYVKRFSNEKVYCITEDKNKNLLIGTYGSGFLVLDKEGNELNHYESSKNENDSLSVDELSNDWVNYMICDRDGFIWIGHYKGVSCFDPSKKTFLPYLGKNNLLPGTVALSLLEDKAGKIWIGTSSGLYCFDKQSRQMKSYTTKNGLSNDVICGIAEDDQNNIWISTYNGISKFNSKDNRFINYYASDGLQGNEFTRGAVFNDNRGKLFFGGINGVTSFNPKEIVEEKRELDILLTNFYLFNQPIKKGDKSGGNEIVSMSVLDADSFTLSYSDNTFSFEFSTLDFINPERISYQYMIEGLNSEWMSTSPGISRVTYNNLPSGTYTFKVRAYDNDNYSPVKTIRIIITPPWYKTVWAYGAYAILFIFLVYGIVGYLFSRIRYKQEMMEKDHAEKISEAKLQFFINISHEIRTPMTLIINPLEKLISENKELEKQKVYMMIYRNSQRILRLINQLMDIRRLDKGQMRLKCRETDIVGFIDDLMLTFEYQAKRSNIDFSFEHEDKLLKVWIDLNNFDKVLLNIFSNAFKYTPEYGKITVKLTTGTNTSTRGPLKEYFEISVSDTGIGLDKDKIEKIFERFYQINNDQTNSNFGTGIGLHLSRLLVELHHGIIYAENRTDKQGSHFVIRLPLGCAHFNQEELQIFDESESLIENRAAIRTATSNKFEEEFEEDTAKRTKSRTKYRILIVEDEDEIRQYMRDELSSEYRIKECKNGKEALEYILKEKPDLIISDVMMPEMDGIALSRRIKQNININHIPIILLTAKSKTEDKLEGLEIGADAYLVKPFNTDILKQTIGNLIANRERLKSKFTGSQQQEDKIAKIEMKSADEILIEKVMKVINADLSNPDLNVEMLASSVGISRVHMHRKLKELTNQSARDFIRGIRLKQAATLLTSKKLSISEVAYATGFSNLSHFSNSFKEFYGMSPSEYINANLSQESD